MTTYRPIRSIAAACAGLVGLAGLVLSAPLVAAPVAPPEPTVLGLWQRVEKPQTWVLMLDRGNGLYEGVVAKTFPDPGMTAKDEICGSCTDERKNQPILGISLIRDLKRKGRVYEDGNILDPRNGQVWSAMVTVSPDGQTMTLRGYLGTPMLGQDDIWKRLPDTAVADLDPAIVAKFMPDRTAQLGAKPGAGPAAPVTVGKPKAAPVPAPMAKSAPAPAPR